MIYKFQEITQTSKNSYKFNRSSKSNKLYMKNDQKNPIYPSVLVSCMFKQTNLRFSAEQDKTL